MRRMLSSSQKIEARTFPAGFCTRNFLGGGVRPYAAIELIVALPSGCSDITSCQWLPIAIGNHLYRA